MLRDSKRGQRGFTLLEILVALAVFAVVGSIAYRGLDLMSSNKAHLDREMRIWRELGQVMDRMETDFMQIAPQGRVDASGTLRPPVSYGVRDSLPQLELVRFDGRRPPVRVAYRLRGQQLELLVWKVDSEEYRTYRLLDNVERCEFSFVDHQREWHRQWPVKDKKTRPSGIRVQIGIAGQGDFERIFALP